MTIEEVNARYAAIFDTPNPELTFQFGWIAFVIVLVFSLCVLAAIHQENKNEEETGSGDRSLLLGIGVCLIVGVAGGVFWGGLTSYDRYDDQKQALMIETKQQIADWKKHVAEPYLQAVPTENHTLVYMKIDPEIETTIEGFGSLGSGYITSHSELLTPMVISYKKDGQLATYSARFPSTMDLAADGDPYVSFKTLTAPLGVVNVEARSSKLCYGFMTCFGEDQEAEYQPGAYDYSVHLPKDYTFKDIK